MKTKCNEQIRKLEKTLEEWDTVRLPIQRYLRKTKKCIFLVEQKE